MCTAAPRSVRATARRLSTVVACALRPPQFATSTFGPLFAAAQADFHRAESRSRILAQSAYSGGRDISEPRIRALAALIAELMVVMESLGEGSGYCNPSRE